MDIFSIMVNEATASLRTIPFKCVSAADHLTKLPGLTFSAGQIKISKNGAAEGNHTGSVSEVAGGGYSYAFSQGEVDTRGYVTFRIDNDLKAGVDDIFIVVKVTPTETFRKNTAFDNFKFKMVLASDHVSPATTLTVTAERQIDAGSFTACSNSVVEIGSGWYRINLSAADLNGGSIALKFTAATADQRDILIATV